MNRRLVALPAALASVALLLAGCGTNTPAETSAPTTGTSTSADPTGQPSENTAPKGELTLAGWSLATTPEFQTLADGFNATNPAYTVKVSEYDATNYDTQMIADLAAGTAPDLYIQKNLKNFYTYASGEQLVDVSDIAGGLGDNPSVSFYQLDGKTYAVPYRQDGWVLYYNKDLFKKAGVAEPDGSWTWDDYATAATELSTKLKAAGSEAKGAYQHGWQSIIQGFANAQTPNADVLSGDYGYMKPYYERALKIQSEGGMESYGNVTTNKLTYQSQFGTQKAAMMPMGSWYIATLLAQQASGEADKFEWGIAPAPQFDESTAGKDKTPVTFGDPTGIGINPTVEGEKLEAAKAFLAYVASADAAKELVKIGITPSVLNDEVAAAVFEREGMPTDELSKWAYQTREVKPENPVSPYTAGVQNILNETHSAVMSTSEGVEAFDKAGERAKAEVLNQ